MDAVLAQAALAAAGVGAGFLNTVAGGGSLLTLPALMLLGLPANLANGTNRLSIVSASLTGAVSLERDHHIDRRGVWPAVAASAVGSALGALFATWVPAAALKTVLLGALLVMATLILINPRAIGAPRGQGEPRWDTHRAAGLAGILLAGLYGGFIQAGVGFVLLAVLGGILHYDVLGAAALKLVCTLVFGAVALVVFAWAGQVVWATAALLACYTAVGALLGVRLAKRAPHRLLRVIAFACVVATSIGAWLKG